MLRIRLTDVSTSFLLLCEGQRFSQAADVIRRSLRYLQTESDYRAVLDLLLQIPLEFRLSLHDCRRVFAHVLALNGLDLELQDFIVACEKVCLHVELAELQLEYAAILEKKRSFLELRLLLEPLLPMFSAESLGRAETCLGWALFELKDPTWKEHFQRGLALLQGIFLARALINYGYCLSEAGLSAQAEAIWLEALPLVRHRVRTTAHLLYNLGVTAQRHFLIQAEQYFLELERVARFPEAASLNSAAWSGIALARRVRGQWSRSEVAYEKALAAAQDSFDQSTAYRGLARVYLLSGRANKALEVLEFALLGSEQDSDGLWLVQAQVLLSLGFTARAGAALSRVRQPEKDSLFWGVKLLQAELARQAGDNLAAQRLLLGLPLDSLIAREEAVRFPALLALLPDQPKPLGYQTELSVAVVATGLLQVSLNELRLPIPPRGKVAELLVFVLESGGACSVEKAAAALYPNVELPLAKQRLRAVVRLLQQAFGWAGSLKVEAGRLVLDPEAKWFYDIAKARQERFFVGEFLQGIKNPWVLMVNQELGQFRSVL